MNTAFPLPLPLSKSRLAAMLLVTLFVLPASCASVKPEQESALRVLFVGNSLTYSNDLPAIVEALAAADADRPLVSRTVAFGNFSLEDHWNEGSARQALAEEKWDFVVMQQGPSSLPENQKMLRTWTERFAEDARSNGTEPALYTVWPSSRRSFAFPAVIEGYALAAEAVNGLLLPVGEAWVKAWEEDPSLELYGPDNFHPSQLGTYLAAVVIYGGLYETSTHGLPSSLTLADGTHVRIQPGTARVLRAAADEVLR